MWLEAMNTVRGLFTTQAPVEDRDELEGTMARLKQGSERLAQKSGGAVQSAPAASLFDAVALPHTSERRSVGHWCESSAAAAREEHTIKVVHSYESDFGATANLAENNLYPFLSKSAQNKALHGYIMNADMSRPSTQPANGHETEGMSTVIPMSALTDTEELLLRFAQDESDEFVRASVAANDNAPAAAMWLLAADKSPTVKLALIENPNVPLAVLEVLSKDFDTKVARRAHNKVRTISSKEAGIAFGNLSREYDRSEEIDEHSFDARHAV